MICSSRRGGGKGLSSGGSVLCSTCIAVSSVYAGSSSAGTVFSGDSAGFSSGAMGPDSSAGGGGAVGAIIRWNASTRRSTDSTGPSPSNSCSPNLMRMRNSPMRQHKTTDGDTWQVQYVRQTAARDSRSVTVDSLSETSDSLSVAIVTLAEINE